MEYFKLHFAVSDPIFPLTFLVDSWVLGMFDGKFQASFLCFRSHFYTDIPGRQLGSWYV